MRVRTPSGFAGLSANIEWLFADKTTDLAERIRLAKRSGFTGVEIWEWRALDIARIEEMLSAEGMNLITLCATPQIPLVTASNRREFVQGVIESAEVARRLSCPSLVCFPGRATERPRDEQWSATRETLREASRALEGTGVELLVENLNTRVDHPGQFMDRTSDVLDLVEAVGSPQVKMLYDQYHARVMGERTLDVLVDRIALVSHVQLADVPGRGEPGSGNIMWHEELAELLQCGYRGWLGLEFEPSRGTDAALRSIAQVLDHDGSASST